MVFGVMKKEIKIKVDLALVSLLARLTDFQLASTSYEYFDELEKVRDVLVNYHEAPSFTACPECGHNKR